VSRTRVASFCAVTIARWVARREEPCRQRAGLNLSLALPPAVRGVRVSTCFLAGHERCERIMVPSTIPGRGGGITRDGSNCLLTRKEEAPARRRSAPPRVLSHHRWKVDARRTTQRASHHVSTKPARRQLERCFWAASSGSRDKLNLSGSRGSSPSCRRRQARRVDRVGGHEI
jgi:hypothetical protein